MVFESKGVHCQGSGHMLSLKDAKISPIGLSPYYMKSNIKDSDILLNREMYQNANIGLLYWRSILGRMLQQVYQY